MDISRASNFERFVFDLLDRDASRTAELFGSKLKEGGFQLSATELAAARDEYGFSSGASTHADRLAIIASVKERYGYLVDPHTADGIKVARQVQKEEDIKTPIICLETALPVKFSETIVEAIGTEPAVPERFAGIMDVQRHVTDLPNDVAAVQDFIRSSIAQTDVKQHPRGA